MGVDFPRAHRLDDTSQTNPISLGHISSPMLYTLFTTDHAAPFRCVKPCRCFPPPKNPGVSAVSNHLGAVCGCLTASSNFVIPESKAASVASSKVSGEVKNPTRTMGLSHPSIKRRGWIYIPIQPGRSWKINKDHVLMEVWRSFSFLNGWFVSGVHDWLMFMGKLVDIPVTWIQESELSFQFRFCVKIQWLDETCFIYLSLRRIRCLACLKPSWYFAERVHYHIKYVLKINSTYKMNGLVQIDEFLQFTQMIGWCKPQYGQVSK